MSAARPLAGRRLVLTRSAQDNALWARELEALGAEVISLDCIEFELLDAGAGLEEELLCADWIVLGSRRAAEAAGALLGARAGLTWDAPGQPRPRLAAVGGATALAARELFGSPTLTAPGGTMASLAEELAEQLRGEFKQRILELAAEGGRRELETAFAGSPHALVRLELYRTRPAQSPVQPKPRLEALTGGRVDLVLFASPSAWNGLQGLASVPQSLPCVSLGPTTSAALLESGLQPRAEAATRDLGGLIDAACRALGVPPTAFLPKP